MKFTLLVLSVCLLSVAGCRSGKKKPVDSLHQPDLAVLGDPAPTVRSGGNYKLKATMNGFYYQLPKFVEAVPNRFLMRGHVIQMLDPVVGDGWARVKNEQLETGYVRLENVRVVPVDQEPKPPRRAPEAELDLNMQLE